MGTTTASLTSVTTRPFLAALIVGLLLASAVPLRAQGIIRGVVHDSLRTQRPVAGAEVVLLGVNRRATADERGRFEFLDVPPGPATLAFWAPWLDTLALPPIQVALQVSGDVVSDVRIATPSLPNYQRAVCGTTLAATDGILIGEVRGPDGAGLAGVAVGARWHETLIGAGQLDRRQRAALDTTNASGFYALCGVPRDAEYALVAGTDLVASGEVVLALADAPIRRRDLVAGPWDAVARVRGRVVGPDDRPVGGVTVAVSGDTARRTRTDEQGRFVLDGVPRRTTQFVARAIGFVPALTELDLMDTDLELDDLKLAKVPQELSTVTVTGEPITAGALQFEHRREIGLGSFVTDSALARLPIINSTNVSAMVPRTAVQQTRQGPMLMIRRGSGFCRPRFFIDGYDYRDMSPEEEGSVMARAKRIEVYTANAAPPQFNDFDGCGAVVIWTR